MLNTIIKALIRRVNCFHRLHFAEFMLWNILTQNKAMNIAGGNIVLFIETE